jgi:SNF2 family DNA or RNA helicase
MIRRTAVDEMLGRPLLELPKVYGRILRVKFGIAERILYDALEGKYVEKINALAAKGVLYINYHNILVWLLRLRQFCSHPYLLQHVFGKCFHDFDKA